MSRRLSALFLVAAVLSGCGGEDASTPGSEMDAQPRKVTRVVTLRVPETATPDELQRLWACARRVTESQVISGLGRPKAIERQCPIPAGEGPMVVMRRRFVIEFTVLGGPPED